MEERIIELCQNIKNCRCSDCGAPLKNGFQCEYCRSISQIGKNYEEELITLLEQYECTLSDDQIKQMKINRLWNHLYTIRDFPISKVNSLLDRASYQSKMKKRLDTLIMLYNEDNELPQSQYELILFLLFNHELDEKYKFNWCAVLIKGIAQKNFSISEEDVEKFITIWSEQLIGRYVKVPKSMIKCHIQELEENTRGCCRGTKITISKQIIKELLEGNLFKIICTISHEITHVVQYDRYKNQVISITSLLQLKDEILSNRIPNYYKENYDILSMELEAMVLGSTDAIDYLKFLELPIKEEYLVERNNWTAMLNTYFLNKDRSVNDKRENLDELFDELLMRHPELLEQYPQLKLEYTLEYEGVRRKTLEEVRLTYESYLKGNLQLNGKDDEIKVYFENLIKQMDKDKSKQ